MARFKFKINYKWFFLHLHPELPKALLATNTRLICTIHYDSEEYETKINEVKSLIDGWKSIYDFDVVWRESHLNWTRRYIGFGKNMKPYNDNNLRKSWEKCPAKYCSQIYNNMIWKCPPLAYLKIQHEKYGLSEEWNQYLRYKALSCDANISEIKRFFNKEEESFCGMCPSNPEIFKMKSPLIPITQIKLENE